MEQLALIGGKAVISTSFPPYNTIGDEEKKEVMDVMESGNLSDFVASPDKFFHGGPKVQQFEKEWAEHFKVKHAISVNSGTAGLYASVIAADVGVGDEVITSPITMVATSAAVLAQHALPVFADVETKTRCIDPASVEKLITEHTKAIIPVNICGNSCDFDPIMEIAEKNNLIVIEDNAQAPNATYKGRYCGTIGHMGVFSLNFHKTIHTGEGGMVVTNDDRLAMALRLLRNHGEKSVEVLAPDMDVPQWGLNLRMTELQAAVGIAQLRKLDELTVRRRELGRLLLSTLNGYDGLTGPHEQEFSEPVYYSYLIDFDQSIVGVKLETFVKALQAEGAPFGANWTVPVYWYPPFPKRKMYPHSKCPFDCEHTKRYVDYSRGICPATEKCYDQTIFFNMQLFDLNEALIAQIGQTFRKIYTNLDVLKQYESKKNSGN